MAAKKRLTKAEREKKAAVFEAQQKEDQMLRDAESFGGACRREHDALRALLIMLSHIKGMPVVQETINEAAAAYIAVAQKEDQILRDAESFGGACRREHDALRALLIMLSHIKGMPVVQETINEAAAAYIAVAQAVAGKTRPVGGLMPIPELYKVTR